LGLPQRSGNVQISGDAPPGECVAPNKEYYRFSDKDYGEERLRSAVLREERALKAMVDEGKIHGPNGDFQVDAYFQGRYAMSDTFFATTDPHSEGVIGA